MTLAIKTPQGVAEIIPDEHPHVLLHYLGAPDDELSVGEAVVALHLRIATASDSELADAADKLAAYLNQRELSSNCLGEMLTIRANELHI